MYLETDPLSSTASVFWVKFPRVFFKAGADRCVGFQIVCSETLWYAL